MKTKFFKILVALAIGLGALSTANAYDLATAVIGKGYHRSIKNCASATPDTYTFDAVGAGSHFTARFTSDSQNHSVDDFKPQFNVTISSVQTNGLIASIASDNGFVDFTLPDGTTSFLVFIDKAPCSGNPTAYYSLLVSPFESKVRSLSGAVINASKVPLNGATVTAYDQEYQYAGSATTGLDGKYNIPLAPGVYYATVANGTNAAYWLPGAPVSGAGVIDLRKASATRNITISGTRPTITTITGNISQGLPITITGTGFGIPDAKGVVPKGYVDFGGTVTNSTALITSWTDTQIVMNAPQGAYSDYVRVFSKSGGWSDKFSATGATLPVLSLTANKTSVTEGQTITYTLTLNGASSNPALVKLNFSGTAKATTATTPGDYIKPTLPIIIPAGQTTATFTITPTDDNVAESAESLNVSLSSTGSGYTVGPIKAVNILVTD